jgi:hypothetical protein
MADLGLPVDGAIPRENVRGDPSYQHHYDVATVEHVGKVYAEDIERFGYSYDG